MTTEQFRFTYFTERYEETVAFYRDGVNFPLLHSWNRSADDKGSLLGAAAGTIEVLLRPAGDCDHLFDPRPPQGVFMAIEVADLDERYAQAQDKALPIHQELKDQTWGHRSFCLREPNGLVLYFFRKTY